MDAPWRVELFGWLRVTRGTQVMRRFRTQKVGALLAYLAYHSHRSHPRNALIELLWPECDPEAGRNRLSVALSSLRRQLEPPGVPAGAVILADHATVQLNPEALTTDVAAFRAALQAATQARSATERIERLTEAAQLYHGELLPGYFEEWVLPERDRLADAFLQATGQLIALLEQREDLPSALSWARRAVAADPLREESHQTLIRLLAAVGQVEAERRQYRELGRLLEEQFGEEPAPATREFVLSLGSHVSRGSKEVLEDRTAGPRRGPEDSLPDLSSAALHRTPGMSLPTGTVTFLMTDIEGSTARWERTGEAFPPVLASHHEILRQAFWKHRGYEVKELGDGFLVAFQSARDGIAAAVAAQQALAAHPWPAEVGKLRVRMGLHSGDVEPEAGDYHGLLLHHAQRVLAAGHGGQILATEATAAVLQRDHPVGVRLVELGIYRLRDVAGPERLFQIEYPGMEPQTFPPLKAEPACSSPLPLSFNRFFGREEEITLLGKLLFSPERRLVTLMGPGGSGKTRLALELARQLAEAWRGAVWFVPLADLMEGQRVPEAVRDTMRLPRTPEMGPLEQVVGALSRQPSLLVLDNFEQLVEEGALLVQRLLERVPTLTCVVTSRQRLGLPGEREFTVLPLPVPNGAQLPEELVQCESVQLFVDRAQAARPDFQVTPANAAAVAALCQRLEGIPLALELAGARAQVLTPAQMLSRLEQRFELLVSRQRGAPRHRTLRAALDWSYELLSPELRRFFAGLSVFRGGFTLAAAEVVCEKPGAVDDLAELRDCSLVLVEESAEEMCYRLLETLREYGAEQLTPEEHDALAGRHAAYYLALAERAEGELAAAAQGEWLERLEREHDNLRAALRHAIRSGAAEPGLRLAAAVWRFWFVRGYWSEGRDWLAQVLSLTSAADATAARAKALLGAGALARRQGENALARAHFEEGLALRQKLGEPRAIAEALNLLAVLAREEGDPPRAERLFADALALLSEEDHGLRGRLFHNLALLAVERGDVATGRQLYTEALQHRRAAGDARGVAETLGDLGTLAQDAGDLAEARRIYRESLALRRSLRDRYGIASLLNNLGEVAEAEGNLETAVTLFTHAERIFRELNSRDLAVPGAALQRLAGRLGEARLAELRAAAEQKPWEELVEPLEVSTVPP